MTINYDKNSVVSQKAISFIALKTSININLNNIKKQVCSCFCKKWLIYKFSALYIDVAVIDSKSVYLFPIVETRF